MGQTALRGMAIPMPLPMLRLWLSLLLFCQLLFSNTMASFPGPNREHNNHRPKQTRTSFHATSTRLSFLSASRRQNQNQNQHQNQHQNPKHNYNHNNDHHQMGYGWSNANPTDRISIATTASLLLLRGGSNKSEIGASKANSKNNNNNSNSSSGRSSSSDDKRRSNGHPKKELGGSNNNNNNNDRDKPGNRNHKTNRKNDRRKKTENNDNDNDDNADDDSDDAREATNATTTSTTSSTTVSPDSTKARSKLFLVDPFRMNELARFEASIEATDDEEAGDDKAAEDVSVDAAIVKEPEEDGDNDNEDEKRKVKKDKRKRDRTKTPATATTTTTATITANEQSATEDTKAPTTGASKEESVLPGDDEESTKVDGNATATATTTTTPDESNSYWWVDVWTQHLSDPEDLEEQESVDLVDVAEDVVGGNAEPSKSASNDNNIIELLPEDDDDADGSAGGKARKPIIRDGDKRKSNARKKRDRDERSSVEIPEPASPESDANATVNTELLESTTPPPPPIEPTTSSSENDTLAATVDAEQNATAGAISSSLSLSDPAPSYLSTGGWVPIDNLLTVGLASVFPSLRISRRTRILRKVFARVTGLHGIVSGKPSSSSLAQRQLRSDAPVTNAPGVDPESMYNIQKQIAAIDKARQRVERAEAEEKRRRRKRSFWGFGAREDDADGGIGDDGVTISENDGDLDGDDYEVKERKVPKRTPEEIQEEFQRMERVREIDTLIVEGQQRLADLICEKDVLQRRPNPLFNYTTKETITTTEVAVNEQATTNVNDKTKSSVTSNEANESRKVEIQATREMNFPPDDLVAEYLDMMLSTRRLTKMNHTKLWRENDDADESDDEESIGDDLFTPSADAHRLYQPPSTPTRNGNGGKNGKNGKKGGGGSWLLRQSIGNGPTLGEKIGQAVETAAYKAVTAALMSFLARLISSLHGINVMKHSDIRLVLEQSPDLPPVPKDGIIRGDHSNYAEETIKTVMRRKSKKSKKRSSKRRLSEVSFLQQEAVTETLLSHVQISAPLLKLFPLAWQRALLGNIIALSCAIISDFVDGLHFQILGHQLSFAFRPITEVDMVRHFQMAGGRFNQRRYKAAEFEAAVQATAEDLKEELKFLDSWHERALGSGVLRTQIADMIARIVLTLTDDVLSGARMDLWSAQAGGPRMLAGLEHRIEEQS